MQDALGADIVMVFDECTAYPAEHAVARESMQLSLRWAKRSRAAFDELKRDRDSDAALFGIVQGGVHHDLRRESLAGLQAIDFPGYAVGGLAVGEPEEERLAVLEGLAPALPAERPRYLMGVGTPADLVKAVARGMDMFDCVIPTRHARNGQLFTSEGPLNIRNSRFQADTGPIDPRCGCYACRQLFALVLAASAAVQRDPRRAPRDDPQPPLLPGAHGADAGGHRGRALRGVCRGSR